MVLASTPSSVSGIRVQGRVWRQGIKNLLCHVVDPLLASVLTEVSRYPPYSIITGGPMDIRILQNQSLHYRISCHQKLAVKRTGMSEEVAEPNARALSGSPEEVCCQVRI